MKKLILSILNSKIVKGSVLLITIKCLFIFSVIIIQSCSNFDDEKSPKIKESFNLSKIEIGKTKISVKEKTSNMINKRSLDDNSQDIYLVSLDGDASLSDADFQNISNSVYDFYSLNQVLMDYNLSTSLKPNNGESDPVLVVNVNEQELLETLNPAIQEAKNYLKNKGFKDNDIIDMINEEGLEETDLIVLVSVLSSYENADFTSYSLQSMFVTPTFALDGYDVIMCGIAAFGADVIWALGTQDATKWTVKAIKKAGAAVGKRLLGPIGVAITLVSFGTCLSML
jgi:hypothetical protein